MIILEAGSDIISFHLEINENIKNIIEKIKKRYQMWSGHKTKNLLV